MPGFEATLVTSGFHPGRWGCAPQGGKDEFVLSQVLCDNREQRMLSWFLPHVVCCSSYHPMQDISSNDLLGPLLKNIMSKKVLTGEKSPLLPNVSAGNTTRRELVLNIS